MVGDGEGNVQDFEIGDYEDSADNKKYKDNRRMIHQELLFRNQCEI